MAGFFDTSGLDADPYSGTTNNAAADYARLSENNPSWFGGRKKKEVQKEALDTSASMPVSPTAPTPQNPTAAESKPSPALTSAPGLVTSVLQQIANPPQYNAQGASLVPGTPFTPQEFTQQLVQQITPKLMSILQPQLEARPGDVANPSLAPFQVPQFNGPQPPQREQQSPFGNQRFGGAQFGGARFGGNTFGGAQFGASASPPMAPPQAQPAAPAGPSPGGPMTPMPGQPPSPQDQLLALMKARQQSNMTPMPGFYRGGTLQLARGGYPELMGGMPMREHAKGGVPSDGQGDGRSDHVQALLSPGEFVMDAETVALAGNGDSDAGARGMEAIRKTIRKEKGKALAKGKFSPAAKKPGFYAAVGMRGAK